MKNKDILIGKIEALSNLEKINYMYFNLKRVLHLYILFEDMVENEGLQRLTDLNGYETVLKMHNELLKNPEYYNLDESLELCDQLLPHYDDYGDVETSLAISVMSGLGEAFDYIKTNDTKHVHALNAAMIDVIHFVEFEKFNIAFPDQDANKHLDGKYIDEINTQIELADLVPSGTNDELEVFSIKNKICFTKGNV